MRAYSVDLRQRIVDAVRDGHPQPSVAERFGVSLSSVQRFVRLHKEQASLAAKPLPGRKPAFDADQRQELQALLQQRTDWTLHQLADTWRQHSGLRVSVSALHRCVRQLYYRYKKESHRQGTLPTETGGLPRGNSADRTGTTGIPG